MTPGTNSVFPLFIDSKIIIPVKDIGLSSFSSASSVYSTCERTTGMDFGEGVSED